MEKQGLEQLSLGTQALLGTIVFLWNFFPTQLTKCRGVEGGTKFELPINLV